MKQIGVLLLPPGWDASPSQGYPQQYVAGTHVYTWVKRDNVEKSFLSKETIQQCRDQQTNHRSSDLPTATSKVRRAISILSELAGQTHQFEGLVCLHCLKPLHNGAKQLSAGCTVPRIQKKRNNKLTILTTNGERPKFLGYRTGTDYNQEVF